jgi:hypothetical protein
MGGRMKPLSAKGLLNKEIIVDAYCIQDIRSRIVGIEFKEGITIVSMVNTRKVQTKIGEPIACLIAPKNPNNNAAYIFYWNKAVRQIKKGEFFLSPFDSPDNYQTAEELLSICPFKGKGK